MRVRAMPLSGFGKENAQLVRTFTHPGLHGPPPGSAGSVMKGRNPYYRGHCFRRLLPPIGSSEHLHLGEDEKSKQKE